MVVPKYRHNSIHLKRAQICPVILLFLPESLLQFMVFRNFPH